jgi:hypothetical protein
MPELHARLLADVIALGSPYPLVLTGGYAVRAHRLVNRPSQDLDVATENPAPTADIAATLRAGLEARGWKVHALETAPLSARSTVTDPATGQDCEVDILKEIFWRPIAQSPYGPVLAEEDPWGVRVAAEVGWRLLVLAGTVWVLMRIINTVQLVVFAYVIALLLTALLEPAVARLKRAGVPRGPATALTAIFGFVVIGLMAWFVIWQVLENVDNLSEQVQNGIEDLRRWLLDGPFHVTDKQINGLAQPASYPPRPAYRCRAGPALSWPPS